MASESKEHVLMLPFMAHGHLIPFLALARQIHQRTGFNITIANTALNVQYLRSSLSPSDSNIRVAELHFCSADHGLAPNTENTEALNLDQLGKLISASTSLETPLRHLLREMIEKEGQSPLCIISDVILGWAVNVGKSFKIPSFSFSTCGGYGTAAYISLWLNLPHRSTDSDEFTPPGFPDRCRFRRNQLHRYLRSADGNDSWSKFLQTQISLSLNSSGWLCNTVEEMEPLGLEVMRHFVQHPVWCIGPLLPPSFLDKSASKNIVSAKRAGKQPGISLEKCIEWLDSHKPNSVLYISFGSQNTISLAQMKELATGIEESRVIFIWVIRPPLGFDTKSEFNSEWLPEGFENRIRERNQGLLVKNWAPQLEILSHNSTGAFLSHCGWNSALESLSQGVKIIGWPLAAEQSYNSKMMVEEMGVSVELTRGVESSVDAKEVKRVIELVMDDKGKGGEMRKKAAEIGEIMKKAVRDGGGEVGSSVRAMDDFVRTSIAIRNEIC